MKEDKLKSKASVFFEAVPGFTARLENEIKSREASKEKITLDNVTTMPTYAFAVLALENDSPLQVVKVMETLRKRYSSRKKIDKEVLGFFDSIEGKAYGYVALNVKNIELKYKFYKLACKCFENAVSRRYYDAALDLSDLQDKFIDVTTAEATVLNIYPKTNEALTKLGELFFGFDKLVESATRVLEGKRPLIEDEYAFLYSLHKYEEGKEKSINSKLYYGLALIVNNEYGDKEKGLRIVKETLPEFKKENEILSKILFKSDAEAFNKTLQTLEDKLNKMKSR